LNIVAGIYKNRAIRTPIGDHTRPTSARLRASLFNICQMNIEGASFLDLFAGSGAMGLEALSRGAKFSTFVEDNKECIKCMESNIKLLQVENSSKVYSRDVFEWLNWISKTDLKFDIIFADPPYEMKKDDKPFGEVLLEFIDQNIFLLNPGGVFFLEEAANALPMGDNLKHLHLKSSRRLGRSALQQYLKMPIP